MNRYLTDLQVFDCYTGQPGTIQAVNFSAAAMPPLVSPPYTGPYIVVLLQDQTLQTFTDTGRRIDHATGFIALGTLLFTQTEYMALLGAGYPANRQ